MNVEALRALEKAVEAGRDESEKWRPSFGNFGYKAMMAFHGSLDAAKALHDAVLPGWDIQITTYEDDSFEASVSEPMAVKTYDGVSKFMARAWLISIIRALIAQAEAKGVE